MATIFLTFIGIVALAFLAVAVFIWVLVIQAILDIRKEREEE